MLRSAFAALCLAPTLSALSTLCVLSGVPAPPAHAADPHRPDPGFLEAKTFFQTNVPYDPRIAIGVDAVVVHRHADRTESLSAAIRSWKEKGFVVGRMFFADSDAGNVYWTGKWDGAERPGDVERDAKGNVVKCAGVRPYMLPTEGWIRYLEEMTTQSVEAGADAVLPEEPLAHAHTGYEESFKSMWAARYGRPWEPESASPWARFLTAQLKNERYVELERRLAVRTREEAARLGREIGFVIPIHSLYSNVAAGLVAPLGTSLEIEGVDGYVGQVWTGPVNWALVHYDSPEKTFFQSAYALYDYFVELVRGSGKRLWLLGDPVEDDPRHEWAEFSRWYRHCVVAKLLFPEVTAFEAMPWPDRIFLPGYATGGGTPAPERNRIEILSALQVLQEVPEGGVTPAGDGMAKTKTVGVALGDTLLWEKNPFPPLQGVYGLLLPLIRAGVPVSACTAERWGDRTYMERFRAIVLSYEDWKPLRRSYHDDILAWVRDGGSLVILGAPEDLPGGPPIAVQSETGSPPDAEATAPWWRREGHPSPLHHLLAEAGLVLAEAGLGVERESERALGKGRVVRNPVSPRRFGDPDAARKEYLPLVDRALREAGVPGGLSAPGSFCLRRGPFVVAHAASAPLRIDGPLVDVFGPDLPLLDEARLEPGQSGLYRDVTETLRGDTPRVLHATHRLEREESGSAELRVRVRGPAETPAVLRIFPAGRKPASLSARGATGTDLAVESREEGRTIAVRFPNDPAGATLAIRWGE